MTYTEIAVVFFGIGYLASWAGIGLCYLWKHIIESTSKGIDGIDEN